MKAYQIAALAKLSAAKPNVVVMPTSAGKAGFLMYQRMGRILRSGLFIDMAPRNAPEPTIRADVVDATLDAYMIGRLIRDYGCSKRDIANTFGASRLGKSAPCTILSTSAAWSAL